MPSDLPPDKPRLRVVRPDDGQPPKRLNRAQRTQLLGVVEQLYLDGHRVEQIVDIFRQGADKGTLPRVSRPTIRSMLDEVLALLERESHATLHQQRERFVNRNLRHMRAARKAAEGDPARGIAPRPAAWTAVKGFEDNVARVQGLFVPEKLMISFGQSENIARILGDLSDEEASRMAQLQAELQHKASLYDRAIDTPGEPVPRDPVPALPEKSSG